MKQKISKIILILIVLCFYTSLISQYIPKTSNKKSPTKLVENSEGKLPNDDEVILRKAGIIITLKSAIYSQPNYNSSIIDSVDIGDVFFVQDIMQTLVQRNQYYRDEWYQIVLSNYKLGWVNIEDFKISEIKGIASNNPFKYSYIPDKKQKLVSVMAKKIINRENEIQSSYHIGRFMPEGWDQVYVDEKTWVDLVDIKSLVDINIFHTQNEVCLSFLWEKAKQNENFDEEHSYSIFEITKKDILYQLTEQYLRKKDYDKAIEYQKICMQHYPDSASPYIVIGNIYWYSLNNIHDSLDYLFQIFQNIPDKILRYDEHNTTEHYQAFENINRIINDSHLDNESILYYYQRVIELTESPLAYVLAVLERSKILRQQQKFELALTELDSCLQKYPAIYHSVIKSGTHYSLFLLNVMFDIKFYDLQKPKEALELCSEIRQNYSEKALRTGILFLEAKILDETNGNRKEVINLYNRNLNLKYDYYSLQYPIRGSGTYLLKLVRKRLESIKSFNIRDGEIKVENTIIYESPDSLSETIYTSKLNEKVTVLYPLEVKNQTWYKIKTSENIIGWIQDNYIQLGEEQIIVQEVEKEINKVIKKTTESHTSQEKAKTEVVEKKTVKHISKISLSLIYAIVSISIVIFFAIILIVVISKRRN